MSIGSGWFPEEKPDCIDLIAKQELRILLDKIWKMMKKNREEIYARSIKS